jgi:flagellar biosynthesis chaperone FliJ
LPVAGTGLRNKKDIKDFKFGVSGLIFKSIPEVIIIFKSNKGGNNMTNDENNKTNPVNANTGANEKPKIDPEKKIRDEGVKKGVVTTSIIGILILIVAMIIAFSLNSRDHKKLVNQMEAQKTDLTDKVTARDSVISEWISTFDDIEKNIAMIKEKEKIITVNSSNAEISKDKKQQVIEDIKYINTLLEQNKKKIASLNAQLSKSGGTIKALQNKISELEATMKQNENEISDLKTSLVNKKFEVDSLNAQMVVMQDTITKKDEKITTQTNELNKAFYVCGTFKELKARGLLTKEGGFIGLGKTASLTGSFPDSAFVKIDITQTKSIFVDAKSAKLISEHPAGSYEFVRDADKKIKSIEIKDPAAFWKASKYAVVEVTK